ncbi:MAG: TIGR02281 family clan AA aspartic protease [Pseudomonadota bacterium]
MSCPIPARAVRAARLAIIALAALLSAALPALAQSPQLVDPDNTWPQATKLIILLAVVVLLFFAGQRVRLPEILRSAVIWAGALAGLVIIYTYRVPLENAGREFVSVLVPGAAISQGEDVIVRRRWGGHFMLNGEVDGAPIEFLFDTGASMVVLADRDARRAGFDPENLSYRIPVTTAAGMTNVAPVRLAEINIGGISVSGVRAAIAKPGDLETSLLGMSFLNRLQGYEVSRDRLVLKP